MSDSDSAQFTVRLVNQVTAPARAVQKAMGDVGKAFADTQSKLAAPMPKRSPLSDWDKTLAKAKMSQKADFAKTLPKTPAPEAAKVPGIADIVGGVVTGEVIVDVLKEIGSLAWEAVKAVAEIGAKFVESAVEAAMFAEKSTLAIGFLTDNVQQAGNTFDMVRHEAQGLGLDVNNTVAGFEKLLAAQFNVGQSNALVKMGADMQAIGASAEEVQRIIYAMTEIKSIGTLQKRQERMLQMAGISGQLIDNALMKRTGIGTKSGLDKARKGGKIGADDAIAAIQDAVMAKTHEHALGDTGKTFADTSLQGMSQKFAGGVKNFFTDVGEKMLGGLTTMAGLLSGTIGKLMSDPQLAELGDFLLNRFEIFTLWVQANWPEIETLLVDGLHDTADAIRMVVEALDMSNTTWKVIEYAVVAVAGVLGLLAVAIGVLAIGAFLLLLPVFLVTAAIGLLVVGLVLAVQWLITAIPAAYEAIKGVVSGLINAIIDGLTGAVKWVGQLLGVGGPSGTAPDAQGVQGVNVSAVTGSLQSGGDKISEGSTVTTGHTIQVAELNLHYKADGDESDPARASKMGAMIRSEIEKQLAQVA